MQIRRAFAISTQLEREQYHINGNIYFVILQHRLCAIA